MASGEIIQASNISFNRKEKYFTSTNSRQSLLQISPCGPSSSSTAIKFEIEILNCSKECNFMIGFASNLNTAPESSTANFYKLLYQANNGKILETHNENVNSEEFEQYGQKSYITCEVSKLKANSSCIKFWHNGNKCKKDFVVNHGGKQYLTNVCVLLIPLF